MKYTDLLCCPFCGGNLEGELGQASAGQDYGVLSCDCGRYPIVAGIPILKKGAIGFINGRPCESYAVIHLIQAQRHREALISVLLPPRPAAAPRDWQEQAESVLTRAGGDLTVSDLLAFYFAQVGGWSDSTSMDYLVFRFGQPRRLMALALAALIDAPDKPVLDLGCGAGHITSTLVRRSGNQPVIGLDRNFFLLYIAKNWLAPGASYVCAEADASLPFRDNAFSAVFCSDAFHVFVNKAVCIREMKRLTLERGAIILVGLANNLVNPHPTTLSIDRYESLVADWPHRLIASGDILARYLRKEGPALAAPAPSKHLAADPWLSLVASRRTELFRDYGEFADWPHADGRLTLNPLYKIERHDAAGNVHLRQVFLSDHYRQQNSERRFEQLLPETDCLPETVMEDLARGKRTPELEAFIEKWVVLGMPEGYMPANFSHTAAAARQGEISELDKYVEKIELIKTSDYLAALIPAGNCFILVDQGAWGVEEIAGRRAIPFLERDGRYWGLPADDETAIRELERLRQAGAAFMVFTESTQWWLHYYFGLRDYLRLKFRCIVDASRLIVFDLRA